MAFLHELAWISGAAAVSLLSSDFLTALRSLLVSRVNWDYSVSILRDLREKLESGYLPSSEEWELLPEIVAPWGPLAAESVAELKQSGIPLVPTLRRLEKALSDQKRGDQEARSRSAQAWGQTVVCGAIVPVIAIALYFLVPGLSQQGLKWWFFSFFSLLLDALAMLWMLSLAESARWAGLRTEHRAWWSASFCFGERLLGALRGGLPGDLAWAKALPQLNQHATSLVGFWGADLWSEGGHPSTRLEPAAKLIAGQGVIFRKSIQASIFEGKGCAERIEAALDALRVELECEVERQMQLLSSRALKPLFICVAPSVLMLLVFAFFLSWESWMLG
ncbi:hypothetical protein EBZ37_08220 [bacterium]|nr:hypothetical protein [bacterium]